MQTVAIFGVGLIGGSFALALRRAGFAGTILGVSSEATLAKAIEMGVINAGVPESEAASEADLIYLAQPIAAILSTLSRLDPWVKPTALVTDAGSTKKTIVETASRTLLRCRFAGGHPLAGKETRGVESASAHLFESRPYVITSRREDLQTSPISDFLEWLDRIGAMVTPIDAEEHDRIVSFTSHLPQLLSTAFAALSYTNVPQGCGIFGPALIDSTRLALSSFEIWRDIISTNQNNIDHALEALIHDLQALRRELGKDSLQARFKMASEFATTVRQSPPMVKKTHYL